MSNLSDNLGFGNIQKFREITNEIGLWHDCLNEIIQLFNIYIFLKKMLNNDKVDVQQNRLFGYFDDIISHKKSYEIIKNLSLPQERSSITPTEKISYYIDLYFIVFYNLSNKFKDSCYEDKIKQIIEKINEITQKKGFLKNMLHKRNMEKSTLLLRIIDNIQKFKENIKTHVNEIYQKIYTYIIKSNISDKEQYIKKLENIESILKNSSQKNKIKSELVANINKIWTNKYEKSTKLKKFFTKTLPINTNINQIQINEKPPPEETKNKLDEIKKFDEEIKKLSPEYGSESSVIKKFKNTKKEYNDELEKVKKIYENKKNKFNKIKNKSNSLTREEIEEKIRILKQIKNSLPTFQEKEIRLYYRTKNDKREMESHPAGEYKNQYQLKNQITDNINYYESLIKNNPEKEFTFKSNPLDISSKLIKNKIDELTAKMPYKKIETLTEGPHSWKEEINKIPDPSIFPPESKTFEQKQQYIKNEISLLQSLLLNKNRGKKLDNRIKNAAAQSNFKKAMNLQRLKKYENLLKTNEIGELVSQLEVKRQKLINKSTDNEMKNKIKSDLYLALDTSIRLAEAKRDKQRLDKSLSNIQHTNYRGDVYYNNNNKNKGLKLEREITKLNNLIEYLTKLKNISK